MLCPQGVMGDAVAPKHPKWRSPPPVAATACAAGGGECGGGGGIVTGCFRHETAHSLALPPVFACISYYR
eukprot:4921604-Prymnesium_polylepis.1